MKKILRLIRCAFNRIKEIYMNSGNMSHYYKMVKKCNQIKDVNLYKIRRKKLLKYARRVAAKAFSLEKQLESSKIWQDINDGLLDSKYKKEIDFIKSKNELCLYPYEFSTKYNYSAQDVHEEDGLCYVVHKGKKLFFPLQEKSTVAHQYYQLIMEQDINSPHRYFKFDVPECDVFVDVGSAEGIMSIEAIEKAKEVYLLECSEEWVNALRHTFDAYKNKIHIIKKYAGKYDDESNIKLDTLLAPYQGKKIVIKMDIEGMELDALSGATTTLMSNECILSCTTYHTDNAYDELKDFFETYNYNIEVTPNFMLFIYGYMTLLNGKYEGCKYPYFRHGIIRAKR